MTLGADRDEDQGEAAPPSGAQVKEALDRTIAARGAQGAGAQDRDGHHRLRGRNRGRERGSAVAAPSANAKDVAPGSLEAEFASLEINLLSAVGRRAPASRRRPATKRSARRRRNAKRTRLQSPRRVTFRVVARRARRRRASEAKRNESGGAPSAEKPPTRLSLTARVSSVGVRPSDAVRLRVACAAHGAEDVARSKRLEGGRGTPPSGQAGGGMRRRGNGGGRVERKRALAFARGARAPAFPVRLARDLGLPSHARAALVEAVVRRVEKTLVQCAAHARAGDWDDARGESVVLARTLVAFAAAAAAGGPRARRVVALRTQRQLREDERREVLALFSDEGRESESVREVIRLALGLEEERSRTRLSSIERACTYKYKRIFDGRAPSDL